MWCFCLKELLLLDKNNYLWDYFLYGVYNAGGIEFIAFVR